MSSKYFSAAVEHLGYFGLARLVLTSLFRVPTRPEPPNKFADEVWATEFPTDLGGKVYAITGSSSGMGKYLAKMLAARGASVFMLNRKSAHSTQAVEEVKKSAKNSDAVHLVDCDLCDFASVRSAAARVKSTTADLDGLICNAGVMAQSDKRTVDGYDVQIQANHLSHFLLTSLLIDLLAATGKKRGEPARIVQHTSGARNSPDEQIHADCFEKQWEQFADDNRGAGNPRSGNKLAKWRRYQQSKRLNLGFTYALADYIKRQGMENDVIATCAHPGATNSGLQSRTSGGGFMDNLINGIAGCCGHSIADGCLGLASATLKLSAHNGAFYGPSGFVGNAVLLKSEQKKFNKDQLNLIWIGSASATGSGFSSRL